MVDGDYMSLVKTRPVGQWRETLAVLATYTGAQHTSLPPGLLEAELQKRLHTSGCSVLVLLLLSIPAMNGGLNNTTHTHGWQVLSAMVDGAAHNSTTYTWAASA